MLFPAATPAEQVTAAPRIVQRIDETNLATLKGNTHPAANAKNDRGVVSPSLPMTDLIMVLSRDPAQQAAFEKFVASQQDPTSPNYHQWLTPEQVGENYGPAETDIATISGWLTGHGFSVDAVSKDRMTIRFSGNASQVQSAFHTEIHNLEVKGVQHIGNMSDPQIPAALTSVVVGVKSLHNFFPRPAHHIGNTVSLDKATGKWMRPGTSATSASTKGDAGAQVSHAEAQLRARPQYGISIGGTTPYQVEDVGPWDFATIYNITPLWSASTPIDGTGQTIAIAGTSDINPNDIATFRTFFNLPTNNAANTPIRISGNSQPLTVCNSQSPDALCGINDLLENSLDVEWSAAVAKNAQIVLVASYPASATDDNLYDSESYIVNNATARIMNVSYGECELGNGTAGNVEYYNLWQTASSEGIAVFVAAGDSGAASCDDGSDSFYGVPWSAQLGTNVSGLASTPYNTAVGGTDFNWCSLTSTSECTPAPYWSSSNSSPNQSSALGYVPEVPWNDTCTSPLALGFLESYFQGSGFTVTNAESGCNGLVDFAPQIVEQGEGDLLYLVDTVGGSGGASNCVANSTSSSLTNTTLGTCTSGATSTGTTTNPDTGVSQASLTLANDGWPKPSWQTGVQGIPSDGVRDLPDVSFFASDGFLSSSAYLICVSEATEDTECTYATNSEPFAEEVGGTSVATPAMAGIMALINQKTGSSQGPPNTELYKLAAKQTYSSCSAETVKTSASCYFNDIDTGTIAMPCDYGAADGGDQNGEPTVNGVISPNCAVSNSSDGVGVQTGYNAGVGYDLATGLGSVNVANLVNAWPATAGTSAAKVTVTPASGSINSSDTLSVTITVASAGTGPTPTGSVSLAASGNGSSFTASGTLSSGGIATITIPANSLGAGTDTLTATYSGDSVYASNTGSATVIVTTTTLLKPTVTVSPASTTLNSDASLGVTVTVGGTGITPTGTVTLTAGSYSSSASTLAGGVYNFTIPANSLTGATGTITVSYSGDANYSAATGTANVTVTESTYTLTPGTVSPATVAPGASSTVAVKIASVAGYTGTVTLTCQQTSTTATGGDGATCTGGGQSTGVTLSSSSTSGNVTLTVGTIAPTSAALVYPKVHGNGNGWMGAGGGAVLAFLVFLGVPARRRSWRAMLGVLVLMTALGAMTACGSSTTNNGGGGGNGDPGTTAGTYTFTVTATGNPSVTPAVSTTFTVTVN
jgi:hypothetical protein